MNYNLCKQNEIQSYNQNLNSRIIIDKYVILYTGNYAYLMKLNFTYVIMYSHIYLNNIKKVTLVTGC